MNLTCTWWIILFPIPSPCHALDYITFCIANHCNMINVSLNKSTTTTTTTRFGEFCHCSCLPLLPGFACSIHATWELPFSRALLISYNKSSFKKPSHLEHLNRSFSSILKTLPNTKYSSREWALQPFRLYYTHYLCKWEKKWAEIGLGEHDRGKRREKERAAGRTMEEPTSRAPLQLKSLAKRRSPGLANFLLLLLTTSAWLCLWHSRNLGSTF